MQKSYLNKLICICMALMFAIAVIGSSNGIESSSRKLPVSARQNAFCERNADDGTAQGLRLVSMCEDMDDFQMFTDTAGTTLNVLAGLRTAIFVILAAALFWYFGCKTPIIRIYFAERRIPFFRMAVFIHRFDGKKRTCFENAMTDQNRRLSDGSGDKVKDFIHRRRERGTIFFKKKVFAERV